MEKIHTAAVSKIDWRSYGVISGHINDLTFVKHKAIEVNKTKSSPKIITIIQKTSRPISVEDFTNYFEKISFVELSGLEMCDERLVANKWKKKL